MAIAPDLGRRERYTRVLSFEEWVVLGHPWAICDAADGTTPSDPAPVPSAPTTGTTSPDPASGPTSEVQAPPAADSGGEVSCS